MFIFVLFNNFFYIFISICRFIFLINKINLKNQIFSYATFENNTVKKILKVFIYEIATTNKSFDFKV